MSIADVDERENLNEVVEKAWSAFRRAGALPASVNPAVPILFFGDLHAYRASETRVLTVGKNPSLKEFPKNSPFRRFPLAKNTTADELDVYLTRCLPTSIPTPVPTMTGSTRTNRSSTAWRPATTAGNPRQRSTPTSAPPSLPTRHGVTFTRMCRRLSNMMAYRSGMTCWTF